MRVLVTSETPTVLTDGPDAGMMRVDLRASVFLADDEFRECVKSGGLEVTIIVPSSAEIAHEEPACRNPHEAWERCADCPS